MGDRKQPRPVPTNQVRPVPPPAPPRRRRDDVRVERVSTCFLYSTFELVCPLCGQRVPAQTEHSCSKLQDI